MERKYDNNGVISTKSKIIAFAIFTSLIIMGIFSVLFVNVNVNSTAASSGIIWRDYDEGMNLAQQENKTIMLYFHTDWCSWCKKMDSETFKDSDVIAESSNFVSIKVDGDKRSDLVDQYDVEGYPTVLFINTTGKIINDVVGYQTPSQFLASMGGENVASDGFICSLTNSWENFLLILLLPLALIAFMMYLDKRKIQRSPPNNKNNKNQAQK